MTLNNWLHITRLNKLKLQEGYRHHKRRMQEFVPVFGRDCEYTRNVRTELELNDIRRSVEQAGVLVSKARGR